MTIQKMAMKLTGLSLICVEEEEENCITWLIRREPNL